MWGVRRVCVRCSGVHRGVLRLSSFYSSPGGGGWLFEVAVFLLFGVWQQKCSKSDRTADKKTVDQKIRAALLLLLWLLLLLLWKLRLREPGFCAF